jgi:hypothetical protein
VLSSCSTQVIRSPTCRSAFCQSLTGMFQLVRFLTLIPLIVNNSRSALSTLASIHGTGMPHGDIRPENILMSDSGVDFSHSRQCNDQEAMHGQRIRTTSVFPWLRIRKWPDGIEHLAQAASVTMIHQQYDVFNSLFNYYCMIFHSVNDLNKNQLPRHSSLTNENRFDRERPGEHRYLNNDIQQKNNLIIYNKVEGRRYNERGRWLTTKRQQPSLISPSCFSRHSYYLSQ